LHEPCQSHRDARAADDPPLKSRPERHEKKFLLVPTSIPADHRSGDELDRPDGPKSAFRTGLTAVSPPW